MERLDAFMARANAAYYATHDPFRDFTTAPEITQVFGEVLGAWAAVVWASMGRPDPVLLAECGPGRGTLMQDARRALRRVAPDFDTACRLHLVETSARLRAQQAERLPDAAWHAGLGSLPPGPMLLLANEFLDALPIRQFVRMAEGWCEQHVADGVPVAVPVAGPGAGPVAALAAVPLDTVAPGTVLEVNEAAQAWAKAVATRLVAQGGAALLLDYGPSQPGPGDSLQALRHGRPADPFGDPGSRDLTAHVDFAAIGAAARAAGAAVHGPIQQGPFLARLGLFQRSGVLARTQPPLRAAATIQAAQRLAEPDRMGGLFKAMAIVQPGLATPPGFEA